MNKCHSCKHWTSPQERTDYNNAVSFFNDEYNIGEEGEIEYSQGDLEDKKFGICKLINLGSDLDLNKPVPLAVTMDGSEYRADLYTQSEFGCVLWELRREGDG